MKLTLYLGDKAAILATQGGTAATAPPISLRQQQFLTVPAPANSLQWLQQAVPYSAAQSICGLIWNLEFWEIMCAHLNRK